MDEDGIPEVLKTERLGHELPGMHGVYGHVSEARRTDLKDALQARERTHYGNEHDSATARR
jgi:hypothetical protein